MKRYLVFKFNTYYPEGGWSDFAASFDTFDEALEFLVGIRHDHEQIVDGTTGEILHES